MPVADDEEFEEILHVDRLGDGPLQQLRLQEAYYRLDVLPLVFLPLQIAASFQVKGFPFLPLDFGVFRRGLWSRTQKFPVEFLQKLVFVQKVFVENMAQFLLSLVL